MNPCGPNHLSTVNLEANIPLFVFFLNVQNALQAVMKIFCPVWDGNSCWTCCTVVSEWPRSEGKNMLSMFDGTIVAACTLYLLVVKMQIFFSGTMLWAALLKKKKNSRSIHFSESLPSVDFHYLLRIKPKEWTAIENWASFHFSRNVMSRWL
jgi:hypothetical protein